MASTTMPTKLPEVIDGKSVCKVGTSMNDGMTVLMRASANNRIKAMCDMFAADEVDLDIVNTYDGYTALMYAADNGHLESVMCLIDHGATQYQRRLCDNKVALEFTTDPAVRQYLKLGSGDRQKLDVDAYLDTVPTIYHMSDEFINLELVTNDDNGNSASIMLTGVVKNTDTNVFLKVKAISPNDDNSWVIEMEIYDKVTKPLVADMITPHVIPGLYNRQCRNFPGALDGTTDRRIYNAWAKHIKKMNVMMIVTPMIRRRPGINLGTYIDDIGTSNDLKLTLMFQLVYTLHVFNLNNLRHNDLTFHNVLVEDCTDAYIEYWIAELGWFRVPTHGKCVRVFDFDRSAWTHHNTKLDMSSDYDFPLCFTHGVCNTVNPYFDMFSAFQQFRPIVNRYLGLLSTKSFNIYNGFRNQEYYHLMCNISQSVKTNGQDTPCRGEYLFSEDDVDDLITPLIFLRTFSDFKQYHLDAEPMETPGVRRYKAGRIETRRESDTPRTYRRIATDKKVEVTKHQRKN